ncbi:hypothetical protein CEA93_16260 [Vibrio anguillarum]|nr:hypothetical protein CEA93_16260 [Vibrio anguillarum]
MNPISLKTYIYQALEFVSFLRLSIKCRVDSCESHLVYKNSLMHISEHSDQSFRDYPITHFGLNRSLIPRLSDHF